MLELYDERKGELYELRTKRWQEMWDLQQAIYEWPAALGDDQIAKVKDLKFGTEIHDTQLPELIPRPATQGVRDAGDGRRARSSSPAAGRSSCGTSRTGRGTPSRRTSGWRPRTSGSSARLVRALAR